MGLVFDKVNVLSVILDHVDTWRFYRVGAKGHYKRGDFLLFLGIPIGVATAWAVFCGAMNAELRGIIAVFLSVLAALLFNLNILVYNAFMRHKEKEGSTKEANKLRRLVEKRRFMREMFNNISFAILIALVAIAFTVASAAVSSPDAAQILSGIAYGFLVLLFLTLLMLLKRMHALFRNETASTT